VELSMRMRLGDYRMKFEIESDLLADRLGYRCINPNGPTIFSSVEFSNAHNFCKYWYLPDITCIDDVLIKLE